MKTILLIFFTALIISNISAQVELPEVSTVDETSVEELASMMEGSFSSEEQSAADTSYLNIKLHMKRIWRERDDGIWFYVEQAVASKADKPYRQRIYQLTKVADNSIESSVYTFDNPLKYAGAWKSENPLEDLSPSNLKKREGCSVFLKRNDDGSYSGSTRGNKCESDLKSAKYATSEVTINNEGMISWDRGFNEKGEQVWGATKGGYIFRRTAE